MDDAPSTPAANAVRIAAVVAIVAFLAVAAGGYVMLRTAQTARAAKEAAETGKKVSESNNRILDRFNECTTPGPLPPPVTGHPCFDLGLKIRTEERESQRFSLDCIAIWVREGVFTPKCHDVERRVEELRP